MEINFNGVDIDISYDTIFKVLRKILIEDYGLDKPGIIMTKDMITRILTDLKIKYSQEDVDETVEEKLTPEETAFSWSNGTMPVPVHKSITVSFFLICPSAKCARRTASIPNIKPSVSCTILFPFNKVSICSIKNELNNFYYNFCNFAITRKQI